MQSFTKCQHRVLLTGTPIQNNMSELWALLHFVAPDLFTDAATFTGSWFPQAKLQSAGNGTAPFPQ